jgi:hypothetical protein
MWPVNIQCGRTRGSRFQKIIYDGLAGDKFLRNLTTAHDPANERMIFSDAVW